MSSPEEARLLSVGQDVRETSESHTGGRWIFCQLPRAASLPLSLTGVGSWGRGACDYVLIKVLQLLLCVCFTQDINSARSLV